MDPKMSASAPPLDPTGEKSSAGQQPPPPYQDLPYAGYPQPGPGYSPQQQGFGYPPQFEGAGYGQEPYPMGQHYPPQPGNITVQPKVYVASSPLAEPAKDYLCYSIFTMICCCMAVGIAALIYSILTREANHVGDQIAAERSSRMARILNHVALGVGIGVFVLVIVYALILAFAV